MKTKTVSVARSFQERIDVATNAYWARDPDGQDDEAYEDFEEQRDAVVQEFGETLLKAAGIEMATPRRCAQLKRILSGALRVANEDEPAAPLALAEMIFWGRVKNVPTNEAISA